jgi:hypothetical protein
MRQAGRRRLRQSGPPGKHRLAAGSQLGSHATGDASFRLAVNTFAAVSQAAAARFTRRGNQEPG